MEAEAENIQGAKAKPYKSQHYNPVVYLVQFCKPKTKKELWEYDLNTGIVRQSTPEDCGCEDYYHSFTRADSQRDDDSIEKSFGFIENRLPKLFKALRYPQSLNAEHWEVMLWFMAIQRVRNPNTRYSLENGLSKVFAATYEMVKQSPRLDSAMAARRLDLDDVRAVKSNIIADRGSTLLLLLSRAKNLAIEYARMQWRLAYAPPERYFYTTDDPVYSWTRPDAQKPFDIVFPLTRRVCAYGCQEAPFSQLGCEVSVETADTINKRIVRNGLNYVYGPKMDPGIERIVKAISISRRETLPFG